MATVITNIRPSTELQAVNVILGALGEAPLAAGSDLAVLSLTDANIQMAVEILTEATRDVQNAGWRFNTLTGLEIAPTATYAWEDTTDVITTLNIFKRPADVLAWEQTRCSEMSGIELVERPSLKYTEGNPAAPALVLFDRVRNRDGVEKPYVYLDVVTSMDFEQMPEAARRYATVIAARRICHRLAASDAQASFTRDDEGAALRVLKREQGINENLNLFNTAEAAGIAGRRPLVGGGYLAKVYPGGK